VELNTTAGHYYGELLDLANTFRVVRTHDGPNSQLRALDDPNPDADWQPEQTKQLNTTREAAREKKRRDTARRIRCLREKIKQQKLRKSVSVPATMIIY
jgi:hypothetical protein